MFSTVQVSKGSVTETHTNRCPAAAPTSTVTCIAWLVSLTPVYTRCCVSSYNSCRGAVAAELGIPASDLELSMGMSGDFEQAVSQAVRE